MTGRSLSGIRPSCRHNLLRSVTAKETIWASDKKKSHVALSEAAIRKIAKVALGGLNIVSAPSSRFEPLLQRALTVACMPCHSSYEKLAILKALEAELHI